MAEQFAKAIKQSETCTFLNSHLAFQNNFLRKIRLKRRILLVKHSTSLGRHPLKERTWGSEGSFAAEEQSGLGHFLEERELIPGGVLTIQSPLHIPWPPLLYCFCWVVRVKIFASKYSTHFWSNGQLFSIMCECRGWIGFFPKSLGESMVRKTWVTPFGARG